MAALRWVLAAITIAAIAGFAAFWFLGSDRNSPPRMQIAQPNSYSAFQQWLNASEGEPAEPTSDFSEFERFLEREGVSGIVPNWQLWRVDAHYAQRCGEAYFSQVPRQHWRNIVPTLKLLRDEVIPITGPLNVVSAYRSPRINACVRGASASKHLSFSALDLIAKNMKHREQLFSDLCALHKKRGRARSMGLGAYFDPSDLDRGVNGRFHIDAEGFRVWGFDYSRASNPCPILSANR